MRGTLAFLTGTPTGHYRIAAATGLVTGLSAGDPIFSASWLNTTFVRALILRFKVSVQIVTPFTSAQALAAAAYIARGFSVADSGGTLLTLTAPNNVFNSLSDVASVATIRAASTGALIPGTRTVDANPFLYVSGAQTLAAASGAPGAFADEFAVNSDQQFPINLRSGSVLATNAEGLVVQAPIGMGAAGTARFAISMEWIEYGYGPGNPPGVIG